MQTASGGPINYKRWDDAKITSYTVPFIKEKAIKLTNAGRATGAVLSTNLLDSLADNAMRAGVPVRTAIGISTKETTLGNPTDTKSAWNLSSGIRREFNGKYPGTHQHINPGRDLNERELVINYHKGHQSDTDTQGKSVIQEALEFYKQHPDKYNTNQSDYQNLVNIIGEEVMKSPEVQKWYREWEKSKAKIFRPEPYKINTNIQNTTQEFIPHKKQGGKMNILEFLKNGSGIHIKKKNRGKFTSYCGGKVTDECIQKGKNSSNPAIRKRATFADNARHFKHKEGGIIKAADGTKTNWISNSLGKVGNFLNSDLGKSLFNGISSSIFGGNSEPPYNVQNNYSDTMTDTAMQYILQQQQQAQALSDLDSTLKSQYDPQNSHSIDGDIVGRHYKWMASQQAQQKDLQKQQKELIDAQNKQQKTNYITNALTNTLQTGLDLVLNYKPTTKKGSSVS